MIMLKLLRRASRSAIWLAAGSFLAVTWLLWAWTPTPFATGLCVQLGLALACFAAYRAGAKATANSAALQRLQDVGTVVVEASSRQNYGFVLFEGSATRMKEGLQALVGHLGDYQQGMARAADTVAQVKALAQEVREDSESGAGQTAESAAAASRAARIAQETQHIVDALNDHSKQIGEIVTLISSIARATHLLSFNASIEAARAGDAGRGFAVVAAEVQRLASQTQGATDNVRTRVESIVATCAKVSTAIGTLGEIVSSNAAGANAASSSLSRIIRQIETLNDSVSLLAASAQAHSQESQQLHELGEQIGRSLLDSIEQVSMIKGANDQIFDSGIDLKENLRVLDRRDAADAYALLPICELIRSYTAKAIKLGTADAAMEYRGRCESLGSEITSLLDGLRHLGGGKAGSFAEEFRRHFDQYRSYCLDTLEHVRNGQIDAALRQIGARNVPKYVELKAVLLRHLGEVG
jgi:hypothetical protein